MRTYDIGLVLRYVVLRYGGYPDVPYVPRLGNSSEWLYTSLEIALENMLIGRNEKKNYTYGSAYRQTKKKKSCGMQINRVRSYCSHWGRAALSGFKAGKIP